MEEVGFKRVGFIILDFSKKMEELGVKNIILTDISKDGTLKGTNIDMLKKVK